MSKLAWALEVVLANQRALQINCWVLTVFVTRDGWTVTGGRSGSRVDVVDVAETPLEGQP